jgi:hypothetical protein
MSSCSICCPREQLGRIRADAGIGDGQRLDAVLDLAVGDLAEQAAQVERCSRADEARVRWRSLSSSWSMLDRRTRPRTSAMVRCASWRRCRR